MSNSSGGKWSKARIPSAATSVASKTRITLPALLIGGPDFLLPGIGPTILVCGCRARRKKAADRITSKTLTTVSNMALSPCGRHLLWSHITVCSRGSSATTTGTRIARSLARVLRLGYAAPSGRQVRSTNGCCRQRAPRQCTRGHDTEIECGRPESQPTIFEDERQIHRQHCADVERVATPEIEQGSRRRTHCRHRP